ncbi:MAG: hypothetical protein JWP36_213 [Paucimonas sp.]|nr:hypothetical protein [Paucimonas sp.]
MPLPPSGAKRVLKHTRAIQVQAYSRDDGLWDLDARIMDTKSRPAELASGVRPAGMPIHDLWLRITIDTKLNIVAADAISDAVPYAGSCDTVGPQYSRMVGLNLGRGFRAALRQRLGGGDGCAHLTELAQVVPTAAIQAFAGDVIDTLEGKNEDGSVQMPFQLGRCHALKLDGSVVAKFYPRWAVTPAAEERHDVSHHPFQSASIRKLA